MQKITIEQAELFINYKQLNDKYIDKKKYLSSIEKILYNNQMQKINYEVILDKFLDHTSEEYNNILQKYLQVINDINHFQIELINIKETINELEMLLIEKNMNPELDIVNKYFNYVV
jgi:hypothetical protein